MEVKDIQKINLEPNDKLIMTFSDNILELGDLKNFEQIIREKFPSNDVLLIGLSQNSFLGMHSIKQEGKMKIKIKKLHADAIIPKLQTPGSSGFDFHALEDTYIELGETKIVRTGLAFDVGFGYELQVRPRSGLSLKTPLRINNSPGTVDSDYREEVGIIMSVVPNNLGYTGYAIKKGERIAQGIICQVFQPEFEIVDELSESCRNGGYGSTGN